MVTGFEHLTHEPTELFRTPSRPAYNTPIPYLNPLVPFAAQLSRRLPTIHKLGWQVHRKNNLLFREFICTHNH